MTPILHLDQVCFGYVRRPVLDGVEMQLLRGEFVALIGPNGAGKTTLLQCLSGVLAPRSGQIRINGIDLAADPLMAKRQLGMTVDPVRLPELLTGRECLQLFAGARGLHGVPDSTQVLCDALSLTSMLDHPVAEYSLGMRQKLGVALGLLGEPALLVLDEPLNGLDPASAYVLKHHLQALCRERGTTVLLATHSLDVAERFIDRALLLVEGRLRRSWDRSELDEIRRDPERSLEQAMVQALA
ncbi:ABC transporter ATP-binding protein [Lysobacter arenosi]|uniref:ABC transporter ATP-binding protein n=1 Tax=Lysobacter arenosi TaxID=2795387 RepID=A0ABX7R803_9GAMM|nr:ABC transporter ATP-binding protein [Lysobacter arenosi]QSX74253.1 ABC transporter ATP-binding protein [Lysobacter arenosi]